MNKFYDEVRSKAFSAFRALAKDYAPFDDANMIVGAADTTVSLTRSKILKTIDTEWIDKIEAAIPALDIIIRNPSVAIEDVDEILPVELSKHITEKSIKHLAQHTNFILDVKGDEVTPLKILNVFHEETALTYENKFVNTLLSRLSAFVDKRLRALNSASGIEMDYRFDYSTEFEHVLENDGGRNSARINLRIELTSPLGREMSESDLEVNERYVTALNRIKRINMALISYRSSAFAEKLGKNYVRPPVIRTNAILKNKNLRECLALWEYIEGYEKVGYSFIGDMFYELPSSDFVGDMYSSVALQYLTFYSSLADGLENNRLISEKHLFETMPEFDDEIETEELDDYQVYDSEYKKTVPVSRLMNNRKKLSEDEKKIRRAILIALKADEIINEELLREEAEKRRLAREKRLAEEAEAKRLREEEERRRAEEEARRLAEEEAARLAKEAAMREVEVRYRRSFLSRYIQAEAYIQDYYTEIKNALLSYKGVKARTSWSKETFKCGRVHVAKMDVKGKALYLYLALDPAALEGTKYKFAVAKGDCPVLVKIKSERKKKHALELIEMLMSNLGLAFTEAQAVDYRMPYEDTDALIEKGLIKVILPKGESLDENAVAVKADLSGLEALRKTEEEATEETLEEAVEETAEEVVEEVEEVEETAEISVEVDPLREVEVRYRRSFLSRYIQAEAYIQDYYTEIKNALLSYKGVKARTSWSKETFKCGRVHVAKMDVKGKALYLYLALDPAALEGTKYKFAVAKGDCPVLVKIKSERKKKHALELIEMLMSNLGLAFTEAQAVDYRMPYEDTDALIEKGLIKVILPKGESLDENAVAVKADLSGLEALRKTEEEATEEVIEEVEEVEETAEEVVETVEEPIEEPTEIIEEPVEVIEEPVEEVEEEIEPEEAEEIEPEEAEEIEPIAEETVDEVELTSEPVIIERYVEPVDEALEEEALEEEIAVIEDEKVFDERIDSMIKLSIAGRTTVTFSDFGSSLVTRGRKREEIGFAFLGSVGAENAFVVAPYTREQYLSLPRKKKKNVLTSIKALLRYATTARLIESLGALGTDNTRIAQRIALLNKKLAKERRLLPTASNWAEAVKRVTK